MHSRVSQSFYIEHNINVQQALIILNYTRYWITLHITVNNKLTVSIRLNMSCLFTGNWVIRNRLSRPDTRMPRACTFSLPHLSLIHILYRYHALQPNNILNEQLRYRSHTLFDTLIQTHNLNLSANSLPPLTPTTHTYSPNRYSVKWHSVFTPTEEEAHHLETFGEVIKKVSSYCESLYI